MAEGTTWPGRARELLQLSSSSDKATNVIMETPPSQLHLILISSQGLQILTTDKLGDSVFSPRIFGGTLRGQQCSRWILINSRRYGRCYHWQWGLGMERSWVSESLQAFPFQVPSILGSHKETPQVLPCLYQPTTAPAKIQVLLVLVFVQEKNCRTYERDTSQPARRRRSLKDFWWLDQELRSLPPTPLM